MLQQSLKEQLWGNCCHTGTAACVKRHWDGVVLSIYYLECKTEKQFTGHSWCPHPRTEKQEHIGAWYLEPQEKVPLLFDDVDENQILCWQQWLKAEGIVSVTAAQGQCKVMEPRYSWLCMYASMYSVHMHVSHFHTYVLTVPLQQSSTIGLTIG